MNGVKAHKLNKIKGTIYSSFFYYICKNTTTMSIIKYQKGSKFIPSPNWKNPTQQPLLQINPDTKSETEKQTNRRLQEGAPAQKQIVDQQMTFNNIINGQIDLNPNAMLYSRPTQSQRNTEVQTQNKSTGLQNFARVTQPTINTAMQSEAIPLVQKQGKNVINQVKNRIDNYIPQSVDKLIKPKYDIKITGNDWHGEGASFSGEFFKDKSVLGRGTESYVFKKGDDVFKVRKPDRTIEDLQGYKKEIRSLERHGAPNTTIQGYYKSEKGDLLPILKQKYIAGHEDDALTYPEIQEFMKTKGFKPDQDVFRNKKSVMFDLHPSNLKRDYYGKIHIIDGHILPKSEFAKYQSQMPSLNLRSWRQGGLIKYKNGTN